VNIGQGWPAVGGYHWLDFCGYETSVAMLNLARFFECLRAGHRWRVRADDRDFKTCAHCGLRLKRRT